ncbi:MAG: hypothetical protein HY760_08565 [Nitrospirae bacterium]|nr:hypothetical protein [Nitrospirota bacterium]
MGRFTEDMTRLHHEIVAMHDVRDAFMKDLHEFFVKDVREPVSMMRDNFRKAHAEMAAGARSDRESFVSELKRTVADFRQEVASDLEGARRVWFGAAPRMRKGRR